MGRGCVDGLWMAFTHLYTSLQSNLFVVTYFECVFLVLRMYTYIHVHVYAVHEYNTVDCVSGQSVHVQRHYVCAQDRLWFCTLASECKAVSWHCMSSWCTDGDGDDRVTMCVCLRMC